MPLIQSGSKSAVEKNFQELLASGRPADQAYAIAKSVHRTNRKPPSQRTGVKAD